VGDDVADAAPGIVHVALVAGNHMYVEVEHRLACRLTSVEPDVVAVGPVRLIELGLDLLDQIEHCQLLGRRRVPPVRHQPPGDHERVTRADRKPVSERERQFVVGDPQPLRNVQKPPHHHRTYPTANAGGGWLLREARSHLSATHEPMIAWRQGMGISKVSPTVRF